MKLSNHVKPISYLKANAPKVIRDLAEHRAPMVITVHGEAKAVLQDIESFERTQESLALLKILALANKSLEQGHPQPAGEAFADIRKDLAER